MCVPDPRLSGAHSPRNLGISPHGSQSRARHISSSIASAAAEAARSHSVATFCVATDSAQPLPQAIPPAAGAGDNISDAAAAATATPPARKARSSPKKTRKSAGPLQTSRGAETTIKRKRTRAKKPKKIPSVHMDHPDWPWRAWPLHYWELRHPVWWQQKAYRERRIFYRSIGETGPSEETRAQVRKWKAENGY